ncbi:MAG: response regulator [Bryobacterales bacterium]|nr:response regulator [Bryobacterales bacterium]
MERIDLEFWTPRDVAKLLTLVENEKRYFQEIIATLPIGVAVAGNDASLLSVNRAFRRYFELTHEEAARISLVELLPDPAVQTCISECRESGITGDAVPFSWRGASGKARQLRLTAIPFPDWFGDDGRDVVVVVEDASPATPPGHPFLENLPGLLWRLDSTGSRIEFANRDAGALIGTAEVERWNERVHPEDGPRVARIYQAVLASGKNASVDYRALRQDGSLIWLSDEVRRIEGEPPSLQVWTMDVSARRDEVRRIVDAEKSEAAGRFAGKLAHDFNNILMVLQLNVEEAMQGLPEDDPRKESLAEALKATERFSGISQQLVALGRPPSSQRKVLDLNEFLVGLNLPAELRQSAQPAPVEVDPQQLEMALRELLSTVDGAAYIRASQEDSIAAFSSGTPAGRAIVLRAGPVRNLTAELEARWNEPFHGVGKGAAFAHVMLRNVGASLRLLRTGELEGEYEAWFPMAALPEPAPVAVAPEPSQPESPAPSRETVMVVDDEESILSLVARVLRREGYHVLEASSGEDALKIAGDHVGDIALIVSDVMLPQMRGTELVTRLRSSRKALRAVFMSGYSDERMLSAGDLADNEAFLQKPFSLAALLQTVRIVLTRSKD